MKKNRKLIIFSAMAVLLLLALSFFLFSRRSLPSMDPAVMATADPAQSSVQWLAKNLETSTPDEQSYFISQEEFYFTLCGQKISLPSKASNILPLITIDEVLPKTLDAGEKYMTSGDIPDVVSFAMILVKNESDAPLPFGDCTLISFSASFYNEELLENMDALVFPLDFKPCSDEFILIEKYGQPRIFLPGVTGGSAYKGIGGGTSRSFSYIYDAARKNRATFYSTGNRINEFEMRSYAN